ncbi:DUF547 domain-containing protein [Kordiimonas lacus]|uniref:DUF547 domain-containing protein n=1 Tax=Kordiimonas lacus TaxID=637679 RepID=A0A1G7B4U7_9PROT|nr:DUF547 domain-containing protein [Kordiimonas lacus]SDE21255.1 Protein of unknown function, DUF547 [Kordiimonas lacus]
MFKSYKVVVFALFSMCVSASAAGDTKVPEPFRGEAPESDLTINYDDLTGIFETTVMRAGQSDRREAPKARPAAGSRIQRGNTKPTRLEGNRVDFHVFLGDNLEMMRRLRDDIASVPSVLPLKDLSRNEQLAYWLNLYNVTLITQIGKIFPETNLRKFYPELWDEKVITVTGIPLSLNDIQHKIVIPKFRNPLVMYGMFQGIVGSPNIRRRAYEGRNVWEMLERNAREFVNSNRGARYKWGKLRVSELYQVNAALFPDFERDLKRHLYQYAYASFRDRIRDAKEIRPDIDDWYVADLYGGNRALSSANTNGAAMLMSIKSGGGGAGGSGGADGGSIEAAWFMKMDTLNMNRTRFPIHVVEYLHKKEKRDRKTRVGNVDVEEYKAPVETGTDDN